MLLGALSCRLSLVMWAAVGGAAALTSRRLLRGQLVRFLSTASAWMATDGHQRMGLRGQWRGRTPIRLTDSELCPLALHNARPGGTAAAVRLSVGHPGASSASVLRGVPLRTLDGAASRRCISR